MSASKIAAGTSKKDSELIKELQEHYDFGFQITDERDAGRNSIGRISFREADELFRSYIPENDWPYDSLIFDPRIFTIIFEKTSRLISNKPKGVITPREGGDILKARLNEELLSYQWDMANNDGSMITKWAQMDMNTRKYGAAFALCLWRYETDGKGKVLFDGPDMRVLNNRDCAPDPTAKHIENCNWFLVRSYVTLQDLKRVNDASRGSKPFYRNLDKLEDAIGKGSVNSKSGGDRKAWTTLRNREIAGLTEDVYGQDPVYKTVEIVTEYRKDRWITYAYGHGILLRDIPNPYKNNQIPISMLRYYATDDDIYGLSEIEPIKGIQKAINAILNQYIDEISQNLYTPVAVGPGVKLHTLEWGKGARWMMNEPNRDFRLVTTNSNAAQYFNNTYSALVASMMNAAGESSLGISNMQPYQTDKTATEVKELTQQRNARDQYNQIFLAEAIKRQYSLWHSMNQALLFSDPNSQFYILRIVGKDTFEALKKSGMADKELSDEMVMMMYDGEGGDVKLSDDMLIPKRAINIGTEKKPEIVAKASINDDGLMNVYLEPDDIMGQYDFYVDVESMSINYNEQRKKAQETAITMLTSNPNVIAMLQQEHIQPKFKKLFVTWLEDLGMRGADRFFEKIEQPMGGAEGMMSGGAESPLGGRQGRPVTIEGATQRAGIGEQQESPFGTGSQEL